MPLSRVTLLNKLKTSALKTGFLENGVFKACTIVSKYSSS